MKQLYFFLSLLTALLYSYSVSALQRYTPQQTATLYEHMLEVNAEWSYTNAEEYAEIVSFQNEDERIKTHLLHVIDYLNANEPMIFTKNQIHERRALLNELTSYATAQVFPMNIYHKERTPYFIDHRGVHCAVGYLILKSGNGDLAKSISKEHNYDYIKDITTEGLTDWAEEYGFTVDELKWIQPGYPPAQQMAPVGEGTNGPVTVMTDVSTSNEIVFGGSFDMLDGFPCNNIGSWDGEQLTCLGQGVVGQINDISIASNNPYIAGQFDFEGDQYPLAKYDGGDWEYIYIPERLDAVGTAVLRVGGLDVEAEVVVQISEDESELWHLMTDNSWSFQCTFNGVVEKIKATSIGRVYGGEFSQVTVGLSTLEANNVIVRENFEDNWFTFEGEICNRVHAIEAIGESIYIGGKGSSEEEENDVVLSRFLNGTLQTLLTGQLTVHDIKYDSGARLLLAGDLLFEDVGFTFGNHLAEFDLPSNSYAPIAVLDQPSYCISQFAGDYYFGGAFTLDFGLVVNHLGRSNSNSNSISEQANLSIKTYPNPTTDILNIELEKNSQAKLEMTSITGQVVLTKLISSSQTQSYQLNVSDLARGLYYLRVSQDGVMTTTKVVLE